ncbi:SpoIIE family protein phosphatase [bacterium]|nr:SpoIIE family protein phosphatase [bacterium]
MHEKNSYNNFPNIHNRTHNSASLRHQPRISVIHRADDGNLWFGTGGFNVYGNGISGYDGNQFTKFTTKEGLPHNRIWDIHSADNGTIWIATEGGVSRYAGNNGRLRITDGKEFKNFTTEDGLAHNRVHSIHSDSDGTMWFGTWDGGISRYDGVEFVNLTTEDGLAHNGVWDIYRDSDGIMWFGTEGGVSRYNEDRFVNFTQKDGLAGNEVWTIHQDENEILWFGTYGGGVSGYDGKVWTTLDKQYGLADNRVHSIDPDPDGSLWFSTEKGLTRYRRSKNLPGIHLVSVKIADEEHTELESIPAVITGHRVTVKYNAIDFKTLPERRQYRCRIKEINDDWRKPTKSVFFDFTFKKPGSYTFEVQAIDRDLNYSKPASLSVTVIPPFYLRAGFLIPTVGMGTLLLLISIILAIGYLKRQREVQAYQQLAVEELQDARQVQMGLMPDTAPPIEGVEIAGKCLSANDVSGDFYDYLEGKGNNEVALVVADVTGKAMKGAMNAVMTDGILRATAKEQEQFTPASLMMTLNDVLKGSMEYGMNVTMVIATIKRNRCERSEAIPKNSVSEWETTLTLANAAHHAYPLLLRDGEIQTLKTGGLPLGMRTGIQYTEEQFHLQIGDVLILMTDGIIEAQDSEEQMYSEVGRLEEIIRKFTPDLSAEAMVDAIINDAMDFGGDKTSRDDDMTVVVAKIL